MATEEMMELIAISRRVVYHEAVKHAQPYNCNYVCVLFL